MTMFGWARPTQFALREVGSTFTIVVSYQLLKASLEYTSIPEGSVLTPLYPLPLTKAQAILYWMAGMLWTWTHKSVSSLRL